MYPEARLDGESLDFRRKARVSRRAGVIDSCLLDKLVLARGQVPQFIYYSVFNNKIITGTGASNVSNISDEFVYLPRYKCLPSKVYIMSDELV